MHKVLAVIRREFLTRVRTRAFVIGTILGPLVMGFMVFLPILLERRATDARHIVVLDAATGDFGAKVERRLSGEMRDAAAGRPRYRIERVVVSPERLRASRDSLVALTGLRHATSDDITGILIVTDSALSNSGLRYLGTNVGSPSDMSALERALTRVVQVERLNRAGVDSNVAFGAIRPVELSTLKVSEGHLTGESGGASFALAYFMSILLYFALLLYGIQVMSSVVEEKSSRIMEVLVSSLSPFEMLLGKVLGVGSVALLQLGIWAGTAMLLTTFRVQVAGLFGVPASAVGSLPIPAVSPQMLFVFLLFFVLGFLFYSAAYAAVGSMCNSVQETQQAQMPITLFIMAGFFGMFALLSEPAGSLARTLSLVPFFAPFVTPVRYSFAPVPLVELLASIGMMIVGVGVVVWIAARIYRIGILSYGKKASLSDVVRWIRAS